MYLTINASISIVVKTMNRQIIAVVNFILTVIGAFTFGYKAVEYSLPEPIVPLVSMCGVSVSPHCQYRNSVADYMWNTCTHSLNQ